MTERHPFRPPGGRPQRWAVQRLWILGVLVIGLAGGCNELGWNPLDPAFQAEQERKAFEELGPRPPPARLSISLDVFDGGSSLYEERPVLEEGVLEQRRDWRGRPDYPAMAALVLRRQIGAPEDPLTSAGDVDPIDALAHWPDFQARNPTPQTLYATTNALGPALWRRFIAGPEICVVFHQRVAEADGLVRRSLSGYFCAPPGESLTEGQAETVVQSVRVWDGDA